MVHVKAEELSIYRFFENIRASIDDTQRKKDTMKTARPVSPLPSEPVTVNNSFSDLESENDKDQVAPEENNETALPKPKPPPPIHLTIKKNIRDQLKSIYRKFPDIANKSKCVCDITYRAYF
ncbi:uncharacterized protein TNCV_3871931 [Trichonephila clavipes]|nr:uncharacterized protein TNCV_3871931 [Trichonephila clavipes]